jgi:uncharacterized protein YggT (Ycf19 family)
MAIIIQLLVILYYALTVYMYIILANIIMSWIPELRRTRIGGLLARIAHPFFKVFRGIIVIGMLDLTPMVGIILYQVALNYLAQVINLL